MTKSDNSHTKRQLSPEPQITNKKAKETNTSVTVLDLQDSSDCVYKTMYYLAKGVELTTEQLAIEKAKVVEISRCTVEPSFRRVMRNINSDLKCIQDRDYAAQYVKNNKHKIYTIAAYTRVLGVNTRMYLQSGFIDFFAETDTEENDDITVYVKLTGKDEAHMYGVLDNGNTCDTGILVTENQWERIECETHAKITNGQAWKVTSTNQLYETEEVNQYKEGDLDWNNLMNWAIGMYKPNAITEHTNTTRQSVGQN